MPELPRKLVEIRQVCKNITISLVSSINIMLMNGITLVILSFDMLLFNGSLMFACLFQLALNNRSVSSGKISVAPCCLVFICFTPLHCLLFLLVRVYFQM